MSENNSGKGSVALLPKLNLFFLIMLTVFGGIGGSFVYNQVQMLNYSLRNSEEELNKVKELAEEIQYEHLLQKMTGFVDFTVPNIQAIGDGFLLVDAEQEAHLTGIKFKGRIINSQSVRHENLTFELTVNGVSKKFTINRISAGNSTGFDVYIPDLKAEDSRYGKIKYSESSISYYIK